LSWLSHGLAGLIALATLISYVFAYTPLKKKTSLNTLVGAIPGALPPMIGWVAVTGRIDPQAWMLFGILFIWQIPHFLAIAWLYKDDFAKAEFKFLSAEDPDGKKVARQMMLYTFALLPISLMPTLAGLTGAWYFWISLGLGIAFIIMSVRCLKMIDKKARTLFRFSILYLTLLLILMMLDKA